MIVADGVERADEVGDPAELLLHRLNSIDGIVGTLGRRSGMATQELEEFAASVHLRLVQDDYRIIRAYAGRSTFDTYIGTVIRRLLLDYYRANRRQMAVGDLVQVYAAPDDTRIERTEVATRITRILNSYIDRLPREDRFLFRLRFVAELSVAQIARSLRLDQQKVYRRLYRHLRELRDALEQVGIEASDVSALIGSETELRSRLSESVEELAAAGG